MKIFCCLAPLGIPLLFVSTTLSAQIVASEVPEANPARPTVSTPATLTPAGYLQFENGGLSAAHSPEFSSRLGIEQVTKLSVDKRVQFLALFEPFTHSAGAAVSGNRPGEVFAGMQAVILPGEGERPQSLPSICVVCMRARLPNWILEHSCSAQRFF